MVAFKDLQNMVKRLLKKSPRFYAVVDKDTCTLCYGDGFVQYYSHPKTCPKCLGTGRSTP